MMELSYLSFGLIMLLAFAAGFFTFGLTIYDVDIKKAHSTTDFFIKRSSDQYDRRRKAEAELAQLKQQLRQLADDDNRLGETA